MLSPSRLALRPIHQRRSREIVNQRFPKLLAVTLLSAATAGFAADAPGLGEPVGPGELAAADFVVMPDGAGLPDGTGTALDGEVVFAANCVACHGEKGVGGINDRLAGGRGSLRSDTPQKTIGSYWPYATTIFDYIRRAMPYQSPGSLSNNEVYALTAYLLFVNDIIDASEAVNAKTLPEIRMPNRDNFVWDYTP